MFLYVSQPWSTFAWKEHLQPGSHLKWYQVQFSSAALHLVGALKLLAAGRLVTFAISFQVPEEGVHLVSLGFLYHNGELPVL